MKTAILVMIFRKNFKKGGGGHFRSENVANLVLVQPVCGKNCNIFSEKEAGGAKAVRKFSKKLSVLDRGGFP